MTGPRIMSVAAVCVGVVASFPVAAQEKWPTANAMMRGCRALSSGSPPPSDTPSMESLRMAQCGGAISALLFEATMSQAIIGKALFCTPTGVTTDQALRVVLAYIDKHPERQHERFVQLALEALADAWPCED
jgi:hypothetical protein